MPWLLLACVHAIPTALQVEHLDTPAAAPEPDDPAEMAAWIVGSDPLVRRARVPAAPSDAIAPFADLARRADAMAMDWWGLEEAHPGTISVALARGARLAALKTALDDPDAALS